MDPNRKYVIDLKKIWNAQGEDRAEHSKKALTVYEKRIRTLLANRFFKTIVLTGPAPPWFYGQIHEIVRDYCDILIFMSPSAGDVVVFDHTKTGLPSLR